MIVRVTFKTPDAISDAIADAVKESVQSMGLDDKEEIEAIEEHRRKVVGEKLAKWFRYGEYVTVECDTDAGTARVVPAGG